MIVQELLSDNIAETIVKKYYYKVIRKGDYYTLEGARKRISKLHDFNKNKQNRLIQALELASQCRGILKAKETLQNKERDDFKRSLRDLDEIRMNPVTIPREWNIKYIPNLLGAYYQRIENQQARKWMQQQLA